MRIVAIGDSITEGLTAPEHEDHKNTIKGGWVSRLDSHLQKHHLQKNSEMRFEVFNQGKSGDTVYALNKRLDRALLSYKPDIITLGIGTNDINSNWMVWPGRLYVGKSASDEQKYESAIRMILEQLRMSVPDAKVLILGLTSPAVKYWQESAWGFTIKFPEQSQVNAIYQTYNKILSRLSSEYGYQFVDIASHWPSPPTASWQYYADGIHPNDQGYDLMQALILAEIGKLLKKQRSITK